MDSKKNNFNHRKLWKRLLNPISGIDKRKWWKSKSRPSSASSYTVSTYGVIRVNHFIPPTHKRRNLVQKKWLNNRRKKVKSTHISFFYFLDQMAGADAIPGRSMIASQHVLRGNDVKRTRQHSKDTTCWWLWCMAVSCYSPVSILSLMGVLVLSDRCSTNISSTDRTERGNPSAPATLSCVTNRYGPRSPTTTSSSASSWETEKGERIDPIYTARERDRKREGFFFPYYWPASSLTPLLGLVLSGVA